MRFIDMLFHSENLEEWPRTLHRSGKGHLASLEPCHYPVMLATGQDEKSCRWHDCRCSANKQINQNPDLGAFSPALLAQDPICTQNL
jgi:hypothetical protein